MGAKRKTAKDYWLLPEEKHSELVGETLYTRERPNLLHQFLLVELSCDIGNYMVDHNRIAYVYPARLAVNPDGQGNNWVEPDIMIVIDRAKLKEFGIVGAPEWIIEIASEDSLESRSMDYLIKPRLYFETGVLEHWIIDPKREITSIYHYAKDVIPCQYKFSEDINSILFPDIRFNIADIISRTKSENLHMPSESKDTERMKVNKDYLAMLDKSMSEAEDGGLIVKTIAELVTYE